MVTIFSQNLNIKWLTKNGIGHTLRFPSAPDSLNITQYFRESSWVPHIFFERCIARIFQTWLQHHLNAASDNLKIRYHENHVIRFESDFSPPKTSRNITRIDDNAIVTKLALLGFNPGAARISKVRFAVEFQIKNVTWYELESKTSLLNTLQRLQHGVYVLQHLPRFHQSCTSTSRHSALALDEQLAQASPADP